MKNIFLFVFLLLSLVCKGSVPELTMPPKLQAFKPDSQLIEKLLQEKKNKYNTNFNLLKNCFQLPISPEDDCEREKLCDLELSRRWIFIVDSFLTGKDDVKFVNAEEWELVFFAVVENRKGKCDNLLTTEAKKMLASFQQFLLKILQKVKL